MLGTFLLVAAAQAGWTLVDNFNSLTLGNINGQNGWTGGAGSTVTVDPANPTNQVLSAGTNIYHEAIITNVTTGTVFYRFRFSEVADISFGLSDVAAPAAFGDFEAYFNKQPNATSLRARNAANSENTIGNLAADTWYHVWAVIDNTTDTAQYYVNTSGANAVAGDQLVSTGPTVGQTSFVFRQGAAANDLVTFLVKNINTGSILLDDIYLDTSGTNLVNPAPITVPTSNAPTLLIMAGAPGFATVSWTPATPGLVLQVSDTLTPLTWTNAPSVATNPVTLPATLAARFYRLARDASIPSTPTNLTAVVISSSQINLAWAASSDNDRVAGYKIYQGGVQIATSPSNSFSLTELYGATPYTYTVSAYDPAGNDSPPSTSASATTPVSANASFFGDWESGTVTGLGNHNWKNKVASATGITILHDGGARQGTNYARVVVPNSGCASCTERAEVTDMQKVADQTIDQYVYEDENSGTVRYTLSVKFDPTWQSMVGDNNGIWAIFLQLHSPDSLATTPAFALTATELNARDRITFALRGGDIDVNHGQNYALANDALNLGKWIDFILTVKYARDNTGSVNLQRRDEGQASFAQVLNLTNVATVAWSSSRPTGIYWWDHMYMRHGLYRNHENFTSILYVDGFTRTVVGP